MYLDDLQGYTNAKLFRYKSGKVEKHPSFGENHSKD
jgi:hypothetical protein